MFGSLAAGDAGSKLRKRACATVLCVVAVLGPRTALAAGDDWYDSGGPERARVSPLKDRRWQAQRVALEAQVGLGMPVGAIGVNAVYHVTPWLGAGAGVGIGSGPRETDVHYAALLQLRPIRRVMNAFYLGGALAGGGYHRPHYGSGGLDIEQYSGNAFWAHFDLGWELRPSRSTLLRFTWGIASMLNPSSIYCAGADCDPADNGEKHELLATTGVALGHLF